MIKSILGWGILASILAMDVVLAWKLLSVRKEEGTLLDVYRENGVKKIKKSSNTKYIIFILVILLAGVLYLRM